MTAGSSAAMQVTISSGAALMCELVLGRFITVLIENPDACLATPVFKQALVDAEAEIKAARRETLLSIQREIISVPAKAPYADLGG